MRLFFSYLALFLIIFSCQDTPPSTNTTPTDTPSVDNVDDLVEAAKTGSPKVTYEINQADYIDRARQYDEVMKLHTDLMPKMLRFNKLRQSLAVYSGKTYADQVDADLQQRLAKQLERLEQLNQAKIEWMNTFDRDYEKKPHTEAMQYLEDKKTAIQQIANALTMQLDKSEDLLAKIKFD